MRSMSCACLRRSRRGLGFCRYDSRSACRATASSLRRSNFIALLDERRLGLRAERARQHLVARRRDEHGVLPLRRQAVVLGDDGPAVDQLSDPGLAGVDHRLDGEGHARFQGQTRSGLAVMQHLWLLVEFSADAVAAELAYHREAVALGMALDRRADIAKARARTHLADAEPHAFEGY